MPAITIIGLQWGDEGKGKLVDHYSSQTKFVVRFQGGNNAGHTIVLGERVFKLSALPSGVIRQGTMSMIGNGCVVDPEFLLREISSVEAQGVEISPKNLRIDRNVHLILPIHSLIDQAREKRAGASSKIGTTGRGIGPAYEDKVGRRGIRLGDLGALLRDGENFIAAKLDNLYGHHSIWLDALAVEYPGKAVMLEQLRTWAEKLIPYAANVSDCLQGAIARGESVLFEGAQGVMLDVDHGSYPFVTSSNTVASEALVGASAGARGSKVIGLVKAYTTRVGAGPFPTELNDKNGRQLAITGGEIGTVTGRPRRCGWLDLVLLRKAITASGVDFLAITKLDVLDDFDEIKICTAYEINEKTYEHLPADIDLVYDHVKPIYRSFVGWKSTSRGKTDYDDLPGAAREYLDVISQELGIKIAIISTGADRSELIELVNPWNQELGTSNSGTVISRQR